MDMRPVSLLDKNCNSYKLPIFSLIKKVIAEAYNLRHETMERQLFEEDEL